MSVRLFRARRLLAVPLVVLAGLSIAFALADEPTDRDVAVGAGQPDRAAGPDGTQLLGRIERADDAGDGAVTVTGWVATPEPPTVVVTSREQSVDVVADTRRLDVEAATGEAAWGFTASISGRLDSSICLSVGGRLVNCQFVGCSPNVFTSAFERRLTDEFAGRRFTAHVIDTRTGCSYELRPELRITTASVVKVQVLAGVLLQAQAEGRRLTTDEKGNVEAMMQLSLNPPSAALIAGIGGVAGLQELDSVLGATDTAHVTRFGGTVSTAADRNRVTAAVLAGDIGPLDPQWSEYAWEVMAGVHPAQQWGISAGLPERYAVVNKNGFFPLNASGWRVGSTGFVTDPNGGGYAVSIMTDGNPTQAMGIDLVETIARRVNRRLTAGEATSRHVDAVVCVTHLSGQSWADLAVELGLGADAAEDVRLAAGGDGPLRGQLVCVP